MWSRNMSVSWWRVVVLCGVMVQWKWERGLVWIKRMRSVRVPENVGEMMVEVPKLFIRQ